MTKLLCKTLAVLLFTALLANAAPIIIGQFPFWAQYSQFFPKDVRFDKINGVHYGYFAISSEGELQLQDGSDQPNFAELVKTAKEKGVKIVISLGGPGASEGLRQASLSPEKRGAIGKNVARLIQEHGLDGIELDWSFPEKSDEDAYHALIKVLSDVTKAAGKTLAVTVPWDEERSSFLKPAILNLADRVIVQTLEMSGKDGVVRPNTDVVKSLAALERYASSGIDKSRLFGVAPFYARSYVGASALGEKHQGPGSGNDGILLWSELMERFNGDAYKTAVDQASLSEFAVGRGEIIVFNGIASLKAYAEGVRKGGFGGLVVSDLACDHRQPIVSLLVTINKAFKK